MTTVSLNADMSTNEKPTRADLLPPLLALLDQAEQLAIKATSYTHQPFRQLSQNLLDQGAYVSEEATDNALQVVRQTQEDVKELLEDDLAEFNANVQKQINAIISSTLPTGTTPRAIAEHIVKNVYTSLLPENANKKQTLLNADLGTSLTMTLIDTITPTSSTATSSAATVPTERQRHSRKRDWSRTPNAIAYAPSMLVPNMLPFVTKVGTLFGAQSPELDIYLPDGTLVVDLRLSELTEHERGQVNACMNRLLIDDSLVSPHLKRIAKGVHIV